MYKLTSCCISPARQMVAICQLSFCRSRSGVWLSNMFGYLCYSRLRKPITSSCLSASERKKDLRVRRYRLKWIISQVMEVGSFIHLIYRSCCLHSLAFTRCLSTILFRFILAPKKILFCIFLRCNRSLEILAVLHATTWCHSTSNGLTTANPQHQKSSPWSHCTHFNVFI